MTNEDIVAALEAFARWGVDDKVKVVRALSNAAVDNIADWLHQNRHYQDRVAYEYQEAYHRGYDDGSHTWGDEHCPR